MDELTRLSESTLGALSDSIRTPRYDRTRLTPGIVHIGVGNFHRAHQAWHLHRLMDQGLCHDWAIIGAGVRPYDIEMRSKLLAQDCLTTLIELDPDKIAVEVVGAMIDYLPVEPGHGRLIDKMADPRIRIVSLTVTESGYFRLGGEFDSTHPDIRADVRAPDAPATAFGAIVAALRLRRARGHGPFTVQSCDNLQMNGRIAKDTITSLARLSDPSLADWVSAECSFPNAMVDCIVPATGPTEMALARSVGVDDLAPVTHEPFRHWVMEDDFCAGRPSWERVGAVLTDKVHCFETMKLRILNGGHQILANAGELLGVETIHKAAAHPLIGRLLDRVVTDEILPHVAPAPGFLPDAYFALIKRRFANPRIVDTTRRVAFDGASRHAGFIAPSIRDRLALGASVDGLALIEALWARYCLGARENGEKIEANDPIWGELHERAWAAKRSPETWLQNRDVYGDIGSDARFRDAFVQRLKQLHDDGVAASIRTYLRCGGA